MANVPRMVLVTGGAGYIGSHVCKALSRAGYLPVAYDNLSRGHRELVKWGPLEEGDVLDRARLDAVLARWRPEAVMHFAALAEVGESVEKPELYRRNNVEGSRTLLAAMAAAGVRALVFSSTAAVYGAPARVPIAEDAATAPTNPYGETKLAVERAIRAAAGRGLRYAILRYFNAAGADPESETGEWHEPESHLIPNAIAAALGRAPALEIFGADYATPDGTCIRDYVHVLDIAGAHIAALERIAGTGPSMCVNLGTGVGSSVRQVVASVERAAGRPVPTRIGQRRPGDPSVLVAAAALAWRSMEWRPVLSDLDRIVMDAWRWESGPMVSMRRRADACAG